RLPEYAAAAYDFFTANPEIVHIVSWHALEPGEGEYRIALIERAIRRRTAAIARAWAIGAPERDPPGGPGPRLRARRRATVEEAMRRLVEPAPGERSSAR